MERMIKKMEETNWKSKAYLWDNESAWTDVQSFMQLLHVFLAYSQLQVTNFHRINGGC